MLPFSGHGCLNVVRKYTQHFPLQAGTSGKNDFCSPSLEGRPTKAVGTASDDASGAEACDRGTYAPPGETKGQVT